MKTKIEIKDFVLGASNLSYRALQTKLEVRALCPKKDRCTLDDLLRDSRVRALLEQRRLKFAKAPNVLSSVGRSQTLQPGALHSDPDHDDPSHNQCGQRVELQLGRVDRAQGHELCTEHFSCMDCRCIDLAPGQVQQVIVRVDTEGLENADQHAYPVLVEHRTVDGEYIGGMTLLFVPTWDPYPDWASKGDGC